MLHRDSDRVPKMHGAATGGVGFAAVRLWRTDGVIKILLEGGAGGWHIGGGLYHGAIDGVDGDVVLRFEGRGDPGGEGSTEGTKDVVFIAADVEEDGEGNGVVTFAANVGGAKAGAGIDADVELVRIDGGKFGAVVSEDEGGHLDEAGKNLKGVGMLVRLGVGWLLWRWDLCAELGSCEGDKKSEAEVGC